jgi:hypothetical protein
MLERPDIELQGFDVLGRPATHIPVTVYDGRMDWVGNTRYVVTLPYAYWSRQPWLEAFPRLGLTRSAWEVRLGLCPWPASWLFERSLHFIARLEFAT